MVFTGGTTPSAAAATVRLSASSDRDALDETVTVSLGTLAATGLGGGVAESRDGDGRITLDDASVPLTARLVFASSLISTNLPEGATAWFNLVLSRALDESETVAVPLTLGGAAVRGADYTLRCGTIPGGTCSNLARGVPSLTLNGSRIRGRSVLEALSLTAVEDGKDESDEGVTLSSPGGRTLSFNIVGAPDAVTIAWTRIPGEVLEKNFPLEPCMRITPPSGRDIPLHYTPSGTATEGRRTGSWDYYFVNTPLTLRAGRTIDCFTTEGNKDTRDEPTETIVLTLDKTRLPSGVTLQEGSTTYTAFLYDSTPTVVSLARTGSGAVTEGGTVEFTVTLGRALLADQRLGGGRADEVVGVPLAVSGAGVTTGDWSLTLKAGTDLNTGVGLSGEDTATPRLRFEGAGARVATLALVAADDGFDEGGETFTVALGPDGGGENGFDSGVGTNVGGGADPHRTRNRFAVAVREGATRNITIAPGAGVAEGTAASFTATATPTPTSDLAMTVTVADAPGADFVAATAEGARPLTIPAGETSVDFTVATTPDDNDEPSGAVTATVSAAGQSYGTGGTGAVTVTDDDPTTVTLSGPATAIAEDGGAKTLTLTLGRALIKGERLDVPVVMGGTAQHRSDYRVYALGRGIAQRSLGDPGGYVRFIGGADAQRSVTLHVDAVGDALDEGAGETVAVSLGTLDATSGVNLGGGASSSGSVTFTITDDDDPLPALTITGGAGVTEGSDATFTVTADRAPAAALAVKLDVADAPGADFLAATAEGRKTVTLAAGATSVGFTVATEADTTDEPDGPVRATLAAGEGYDRGDPATATVTVADDDATVGPTLTIEDATIAEGGGYSLRTGPLFPGPYSQMRFTVRLSPKQPHWVRVNARSRPSTPVSARPRHDYWPAYVLAEFRPGETVAYLYVNIHDDAIDENDETFELVLENPRGAAIARAVAVGTITNDDPMPAAFLARFGRTVAEQALDGLSERMAAPRTPGMRGTLAGLPLGVGGPSGAAPGPGDGASGAPGGSGAPAPGAMAQAFASRADRFGAGDAAPGLGETRTMTMRDALLGSRFTLTGAADATGGSAALWGRASLGRFDGRARGDGTDIGLDGEVATGLLGADYAREGWLVGLALAQSSARGGWAAVGRSAPCPEADGATPCAGAGEGRVEASLTAALPYASLRASQRLTLWGAAGVGAGRVTVETAPGSEGGRYEADTDWRMAAAGLRGALLAPPAGGGPALALTSDALWTRTSSDETPDLAASDSDVTRLRLGLEGSYHVALDAGARLVPKLEVGARHDGGDAETGFGVELGAGLAWSDPARGLVLDVSARTLLAHEDGDLRDRGVSAALGFDPDPASERGPSLSLRQDFGGRATGGLDALFAPAPLEDRTGSAATSRWTAEAAYGLPAFGGRWTASPHVGLGLSAGTRDYTLGWRWTPQRRDAPDLTFGVKATRRESDTAEPEHALGLEATARW